MLSLEERRFVSRMLAHDWDWHNADTRDEYVSGKLEEESLRKEGTKYPALFEELNPRNHSDFEYREIVEKYRGQLRR